MNILVPHNWLKDYIKTNATPEQIAQALSLHAFSVETLRQAQDKADDWIYEIENTPNRGDALSVLGIARELRAILPRLGFKCDWQEPARAKEEKGNNKYQLKVEIKDKSLVPRFSAIVLEDIEIKDSPDWLKQRLAMVGTRAINSVVDITNYLMFDKGQPMHAFDFDKILGNKMIMRESSAGEEIITLDGSTRKLPGGVIVIEDGEGRLIDLCGIMGAQNSEVDNNTKRVLLFVQVYDPQRIRKSSMALGHRTEAALRFEKGIDFNGVVPALWQAVDFIKQYANGREASELIDIVNIDYREKVAPIDYAKINQVAGVEIEKKTIDQILGNLGFIIQGESVIVPSWRADDIAMPEDLAEEVIRIYGYYNLPNRLLTGEIPRQAEDEIFAWEALAKNYLKFQGFFECYTYSATNKNLAGDDALPLVNPLTEEFAYLKTSLLPPLQQVLEKNQGFAEKIKIFELASVYLKEKHNLPLQPLRLGLMVRGVAYSEFKGTIEGLFQEMGIKEKPVVEIKEIANDILAAELDFENLARQATKNKTYTPLSYFNSIKEDLTLTVPDEVLYLQIEEVILSVDPRIIKLEFKDLYQNFLTLAIEYLDREKQVSSVDTQAIREKIFNKLEKKLGVKLKM